MSMCSVFSLIVGRGCLLWPVHFLGKTLLAFALLHSVLQGQICLLLQVFLDFLLLHSSSLYWKGHLFWMLVLEVLVVPRRVIQLKLLQHYWSVHRLGLLWYWMACLGNEQRSFCHFWDCIQFFVDYDGYSISSKWFFPTVVDIMVIWVKLPIPVHFSSLIPKMLMFTLAISCLTSSNLPGFMDLTFLVPMRYCSLQHQTLLPLPVTPTAGRCFGFSSISSFFLELFLHWFPVAYWAPTDLGSPSFSSYRFAFSHCWWGSQGKNTGVICHSLLQWTTLGQTSPPWPVRLGWPYRAWLMVSLS